MPSAKGWAAAAPFVLVAILVVAGYRIVFRPARITALEGAEAAAAQLRARLAGSGGGEPLPDSGEAEQVRTERDRLEAEVRQRSGLLAYGDEAERILASLGALAAEEGVRFRRFAPEPEYRLHRYTVRSAVVAAEGRFFGFLRFFERIAAMPQLVLIEQLAFETAGHADGRLHARFVAVTVGAEGSPPDPANAAAPPEGPRR